MYFCIEVLHFRSLAGSCITHDEFALVSNILKQYDDLKEEIKNMKTSSSFGLSYVATHQRFWFIYKTMLFYCLRCREKNR